jgi:hypothetical protein
LFVCFFQKKTWQFPWLLNDFRNLSNILLLNSHIQSLKMWTAKYLLHLPLLFISLFLFVFFWALSMSLFSVGNSQPYRQDKIFKKEAYLAHSFGGLRSKEHSFSSGKGPLWVVHSRVHVEERNTPQHRKPERSSGTRFRRL